jgi:glycosyltransferase involved in cell wall biosynthesis
LGISQKVPPTSHKVVILLATRNGAEFLSEQLQSYSVQTHDNWELLVSDDGSTDQTAALVRNFASRVTQRVALREGPRQGFWQNFVSLVRADGPDGDFFAYSDQDDIWRAEKLAKAVSWLATIPTDVPALYFTRTELVERDGKPIGFSPLFKRAPSFQNALVQNIGGGNTMVFNRAARLALQATPMDAALISHDWWTYQLVTGVGGATHYDPWPSLKYRQHGQNLVGSNIGARARLVRMLAFANGRILMWNDVNIKTLTRLRSLLKPASAATLDHFAAARTTPLPKRFYLLWKSGVYRQSMLENIGLYLGCLFGRL